MVTEERRQEKGERNMLSFPETKVHSAKGEQPAAILIGNHTKKGWRGGQTQHWAARWQHTGFRGSGQLDAVSPASPALRLEDCIRRIRGIHKGSERKSSCLSVAHRALRPCANCTSQVVSESFSPWHFPLLHCVGRDNSIQGAGRVEEFRHQVCFPCSLQNAQLRQAPAGER